jgi:HAD superfamily hydrolase (TIGR01509 family)
MKLLPVILFDLDGTLIDTEHLHYRCWNELLAPYGIGLNEEEYLAQYAGVSLQSNSSRIIAQYGLPATLEDFMERREAIYLEHLLNSELLWMPFALEALRCFRSGGYRLGLVTSSSRKEVDIVIRKQQLQTAFEVQVTRDDVAAYKPAPDAYLKAVDFFNAAAADCIVLEDSLSGVRSAKAAGTLCYAVNPDIPTQAQLAPFADAVFSNLQQAVSYITGHQLINIVQ